MKLPFERMCDGLGLSAFIVGRLRSQRLDMVSCPDVLRVCCLLVCLESSVDKPNGLNLKTSTLGQSP